MSSANTIEPRRSSRLRKQLDQVPKGEKAAKKVKIEHLPTPISTKQSKKGTTTKAVKKTTDVQKDSNTHQQRCFWVTSDPVYIAYHDKEWGVPEKGSKRLFEMLCLEGQQAGLSWITVLKKRDAYRSSFHHFDPSLVAAMTPQEVDKLMTNSAIIRNRKKLESIITNAKAYLAMQAKGEDLAEFMWKFVKDKPIVQKTNELVCKNEVSDEMSKELIKRGFKFAGSTICYSLMQSCGLVNDHHTKCMIRKL